MFIERGSRQDNDKKKDREFYKKEIREWFMISEKEFESRLCTGKVLTPHTSYHEDISL